MHHVYRNRLVEIYGKEKVEKLEAMSILGGSEDVISLQFKIAEYREKVKVLKNEKGL
jgi:hypothetical protein